MNKPATVFFTMLVAVGTSVALLIALAQGSLLLDRPHLKSIDPRGSNSGDIQTWLMLVGAVIMTTLGAALFIRIVKTYGRTA